jgi:excinuclease UvrABC nuclease subunit
MTSLLKEEASADADGGFVKPSKLITETIYTLDSNLKIHSQDMVYDQADKILLLARDEAHRFANSYRKKQMSKEFF